MVMPIGPMAVVPHTTKHLTFDPLKGLRADRDRLDVRLRHRRRPAVRHEDVERVS